MNVTFWVSQGRLPSGVRLPPAYVPGVVPDPFPREADLTREQQQTTRELETAEANWLKSFGWRAAIGSRWEHPVLGARTYSREDARTLTRAQPLVLSAAVYARRA